MTLKRFWLAIGFSSVSLFLAAPASADNVIAGQAVVIDGDTIEIHGQRIRLQGIDTPESAQTCQRPNGDRWRCGKEATWALADKVQRQTVRCESQGKGKYGRHIAICYHGGTDLNGWMVREGWALAYRKYDRRYIDEERAAKREGKNIWSGEMVPPWDWRRGARLETASDG